MSTSHKNNRRIRKITKEFKNKNININLNIQNNLTINNEYSEPKDDDELLSYWLEKSKIIRIKGPITTW